MNAKSHYSYYRDGKWINFQLERLFIPAANSVPAIFIAECVTGIEIMGVIWGNRLFKLKIQANEI